MKTMPFLIKVLIKSLIGVLSSLILTSAAQAYLTIGESAEIPALSDYQIGFEPQLLTNRGGGANVSAFFDAPFNEATSTRLWLGAGQIDFTVGASLKYVPFPDVDNQPGIGFRIAGFYARESDLNVLTAQFAPIFSKKVPTDVGLFIPFTAVALDLHNTKDRNYTGSQIVFGTEFKTPEIPAMYFSAEVGVELSESYSYISGSVVFPFDASKGLFE